MTLFNEPVKFPPKNVKLDEGKYAYYNETRGIFFKVYKMGKE